jgi:hypothetical protein
VDPNNNINLLDELDDSSENEESAHIDGMLDGNGYGYGGDDEEASAHIDGCLNIIEK